MRPALVLVCCAACSLGGSRPNYQYYVLTSQLAQRAVESSGAQLRALAVEDVTIPGYLDREPIATRTIGHHVEYSRTDRWAEPLDQAFGRTLRENLAAKLAPRGIQVQARGGLPTYDLSVDVLRFERSGPNQVELWAHWLLRSNTDVLDSGESRVRLAMSSPDSNAMASALSEAIARMADEIADRVQRADQVATRSPSRPLSSAP